MFPLWRSSTFASIRGSQLHILESIILAVIFRGGPFARTPCAWPVVRLIASCHRYRPLSGPSLTLLASPPFHKILSRDDARIGFHANAKTENVFPLFYMPIYLDAMQLGECFCDMRCSRLMWGLFLICVTARWVTTQPYEPAPSRLVNGLTPKSRIRPMLLFTFLLGAPR